MLELSVFDNFLSQQINAEKKFCTFFGGKINLSNLHVESDDEFLPFKNNIFDLVISNLNFHQINFIPQFLLQIKNILKPGGIFVASFFGEENLPELSDILLEVENKIYGGISPRLMPKIDIKTAANLLQKAGFVDSVSDLNRLELTYPNALSLLREIKMMGQGNFLLKKSKKFFTDNFLKEICQNYQRKYSNQAGVIATFDVIIISGRKK